MRTAFLAALLGAAGGFLLGRGTWRGGRTMTQARAMGVTRRLYVVTLWGCIAWISASYLMAGYALVALGQVYTLAELSKPALSALTVTLGSKVLSNIFEHNDSAVFGRSRDVDAE